MDCLPSSAAVGRFSIGSCRDFRWSWWVIAGHNLCFLIFLVPWLLVKLGCLILARQRAVPKCWPWRHHGSCGFSSFAIGLPAWPTLFVFATNGRSYCWLYYCWSHWDQLGPRRSEKKFPASFTYFQFHWPSASSPYWGQLLWLEFVIVSVAFGWSDGSIAAFIGEISYSGCIRCWALKRSCCRGSN